MGTSETREALTRQRQVWESSQVSVLHGGASTRGGGRGYWSRHLIAYHLRRPFFFRRRFFTT